MMDRFFNVVFLNPAKSFLKSLDKKTAAKIIVNISTHGFVKKQSKVPDSEIIRAQNLRNKYFKDKNSKS